MQSFDDINNRDYKTIETTFLDKKKTKNTSKGTEENRYIYGDGYIPVFMPTFFRADGNSEGLVFKVLDDVYSLKTLKNMMPDAAKIAAATIGVQVGNKDFPFKPYEATDTTSTRISKAEERMSVIGNNFKDRFKKQVILYDGGISVNQIGSGTIPNFSSHIDFFKQEIRSSLLTPDSRFESSSSNRAVAQEQMSGSMGQVSVVDYIQNNYIRHYYEHYLFDLELTLAGFGEDAGHVHIMFGEKETEDEQMLSQIADSILKYRPDLFDIVANIYYPRLAPELKTVEQQSSLDEFQSTQSSNIIDEGNPISYVNSIKSRLMEDGLLI